MPVHLEIGVPFEARHVEGQQEQPTRFHSITQDSQGACLPRRIHMFEDRETTDKVRPAGHSLVYIHTAILEVRQMDPLDELMSLPNVLRDDTTEAVFSEHEAAGVFEAAADIQCRL